jgi:hypothetical protein
MPIRPDRYDAGRDQITCHHCHTEFVHFIGEPAMVESDDYPEGGLGWRGTFLAVPMECEDGMHKFLCVIQFHKGHMYVGTRDEIR